MLKFFAYDSIENKIIINEPEILLVKEFADLWTNERNQCPEDPSGKQKIRAFKELIYIYMAIDWGAPGSKDTPANRREEAVRDCKLPREEFDEENYPKDPIFKAACAKYQDLQDNSSVLGKLVETYKNNIHKMRIFIDSIDYTERNDATGMPVFKIKDTLTEMQMMSKAVDALKELEEQYKEEQQNESGLRGDTAPGMHD